MNGFWIWAFVSLVLLIVPGFVIAMAVLAVLSPERFRGRRRGGGGDGGGSGGDSGCSGCGGCGGCGGGGE